MPVAKSRHDSIESPGNDRPSFPSKSVDGIAAPPRTVLFMDHTAQLGGGEIALLDLVCHLDPKRYKPVVILFSDGPLFARLRDAGVDTHIIELDGGVVDTRKEKIGIRSLLQVGQLKSSVAFIRRLRKCIRQVKPDLVHTNSLKSDVLGGLAARWAGVPVVWHLRDRIADDYLPRNAVRVFRFLSRHIPHFVIAVSKGSLVTLLSEGSSEIPENMCVVYDGTPDLVNLPLTHDALPPIDHTPLIGIVGRISRWKGQEIYIRAAEIVLRRFPQARFQIVGSAMFGQEAYEQEIRQLAVNLNIADKVEFTGFRTDVKDVIGHLDVLVHASITGEPFGLVVMEGMAQGKPIVCTNGGGMPEVIEDGVTGVLVPMGDFTALATAMETFIADPVKARQFGRKGWERVRDHFTIDKVSTGVQAVYDFVVPTN